MKPQLERVEIESLRGRNDYLAVYDTALRQINQKGRTELGEVAIERPQLSALDEYIGFAAKYDRAKSIPLRLVQESSGNGELLGELREHRLDRGRDCEIRGGLAGRHRSDCNSSFLRALVVFFQSSIVNRNVNRLRKSDAHLVHALAISVEDLDVQVLEVEFLARNRNTPEVRHDEAGNGRAVGVIEFLA
jgi:hypothetical protein